MRVIEARNVCEALPQGLDYLTKWGEWQDSRAGRVLVSPCPVTTVYSAPMERVLFSPARDANPFFHLAEALWMLAGRDDGEFLDTFVSDFSERFADPHTRRLHGAYGFRWRRWFGEEEPIDQLDVITKLLKQNPEDRRIVLTMWDPAADLDPALYATPGAARDIPCNTHAYFRVRDRKWVDLTVCCRSNDIVWGAYGANAVHFAFLLEYVAAMSGYRPGKMYQVSNNYHVYETIYRKLLRDTGAASLERNEYKLSGMEWEPLVGAHQTFDADLEEVLAGRTPHYPDYNPFLTRTAAPAMAAMRKWRDGERAQAVSLVSSIQAPDWRLACAEWLGRRMG